MAVDAYLLADRLVRRIAGVVVQQHEGLVVAGRIVRTVIRHHIENLAVKILKVG